MSYKSVKDVVTMLQENGFVLKSQKGSHMKFEKDGKVVIVPNHNSKGVEKGTYYSIVLLIKKGGNMKTVEVIVEHAGKNLSAYIEDAPVITVGNDMKELEDNMKEAIELYLEDNSNPCEVLSGEFELKFKIDAATFINYYSNIFTKAALSRITGINERQLWHYAAGVHKPRRQQLEKIQRGIQSLTKELSAINLL